MFDAANLKKHFGNDLSEGQKVLFKKLEYFLNNEESKSAFILKGYAGTGKTTAIAALVKLLGNYKFKCVLLAPTGRAAKVLSNYTGKQALTIHKKIYRRKSASDLSGGFVLGENKHFRTLFIVDEASMITDKASDQDFAFGNSRGLLEDLIDYVYGTNTGCRILFVGDIAQLPPVGSEQSPALEKDYLQSSYQLKVFDYELTEVLRQEKNSGILENATLIRDSIPLEHISVPQLLTKGLTDIYKLYGDRLPEGINYAYDKYGIENTLIICRSNKNANSYNMQIRNRILYREELINGGDHIMIVKNNYFWLPEESESSFIANGDTAKVIRIRNTQEMHGFTFAEASLQLLDVPGEPIISAKILLDTILSESPSLTYEDNQKLFQSVMKDYEHIRNKKERFEKLKLDPYYNALQIKFAYAVTCHKSQGGQWPCVFIDQGYLTDEMINKEFLRWLYTAITRATKEVFLVNFNASFFA